MALAWAIAIPLAESSPGLALASTDQASGFVVSKVEWEPLDNVSNYVFEGTEFANGDCEYQWPEVSVSEGESRELRVIGVDLDDCRLLIEEGTPRQPLPAAKGKGYRSDTVHAAPTGDVPLAESQEGMATLAASGRTWGRHDVAWRDPLGIAVNRVTVNNTWSWNGACAYAPEIWAFYQWFQPSGWSRESNVIYASTTQSCAWWLGDGRATYATASFALGR